MEIKNPLFDEFASANKTAWESLISKDLKGKDLLETLYQKNYEGIKIAPNYTAEDLQKLNFTNTIPGQFPYVRGVKKANNWLIKQIISADDPKIANSKGLNALMNGADALSFKISEHSIPEKFLNELLEDILIEHISIHFDAGNQGHKILDDLIMLSKERGLTKSFIKGSIDYDPLGNIALTGKWFDSEKADFEIASNLLHHAEEHLPCVRVINISGDNYSNAGATVTQEIAYSLAQAHEYLVRLAEKNHSIDSITARLQFTLGIGNNYLMEIAKIRVLRMLWAKIVEQYKPAFSCSSSTIISSVGSAWNKTIYDPWVNMLRSTTECMSAAIGGADIISLFPYDAAFRLPDEFSERIARNTQLILAEEAYLNKVADPAGGSYYIENLTNSIAEESWKIFQQIELVGGFTAALKSEMIQTDIDKVAQLKQEAINSGKDVLLGTNKHPNKNEKSTSKTDLHKDSFKQENTLIKPLKIFRVAEELESIRMKEEHAFKEVSGN